MVGFVFKNCRARLMGSGAILFCAHNAHALCSVLQDPLSRNDALRAFFAAKATKMRNIPLELFLVVPLRRLHMLACLLTVLARLTAESNPEHDLVEDLARQIYSVS